MCVKTMVAGLVALGVLLGADREARADGAGQYMAQSLGRMMVAVRELTDTTNLGYDEGGVCLAGVSLQPGRQYELERHFRAGVRYALIAGGDDDALDVDLQVLDNGRVVAGDTSTAPLASLEFTPARSGQFTVRLKLYRAARMSFCSFAIMRRNGIDVPVRNLVTAGDGFLNMCTALGEVGQNAGRTVSFLNQPNQAAVWGVVVRGNESRTISNIELGGRLSVVLAAGDTQARDLDLYLKDSRGVVLAEDIKPDARPVVPYQANEGCRYAITLTNAQRNGNPSFALFGVVQVR